MSDNQEPRQPPTPAPKEIYSDARQRKPFSASLQRASYNSDDMIWPASPDIYSDAAPTLPKRGREFSIQINATTLMVLGGVALLLIVILLAVMLMRPTAHPTTQRKSPDSGGAIAQGTMPASATLTPVGTTAAAASNTPGGNPVGAATGGSAPSAATKLPTATPTPPTCDPISPAGSPVTVFGDDVSGGSGSGATIGSLLTYLYIKRAVSGNECIITSVQQIVNVNLNSAPETLSPRCNDAPYPCVAKGTLFETDQATHQIVSTDTKQFPFNSFGAQVSRNIYGGLDSSPRGGSQCVTGTTEYIDNFSLIHEGGNIVYCWSS